MNIKKWFLGAAVAVDELGNAVLLDGDAHETISAHCGAQIEAKQACRFCSVVCRVLGWFWHNHCAESWAAEKPMVNAAAGLPGEKE
jgi:hypothetical protein